MGKIEIRWEGGECGNQEKVVVFKTEETCTGLNVIGNNPIKKDMFNE